MKYDLSILLELFNFFKVSHFSLRTDSFPTSRCVWRNTDGTPKSSRREIRWFSLWVGDVSRPFLFTASRTTTGETDFSSTHQSTCTASLPSGVSCNSEIFTILCGMLQCMWKRGKGKHIHQGTWKMTIVLGTLKCLEGRETACRL